ncbi:hypothetical protein D3C84_1149310 [compost metagenome]
MLAVHPLLGGPHLDPLGQRDGDLDVVEVIGRDLYFKAQAICPFVLVGHQLRLL